MSAETVDRRPIVTLFGSYSPRPGEPLYELAYQIGRALGGAGFVVCNGGYDGTMEASARGAKEAGGTTIGVTCSVFSDYRGRPLKANPWIDKEIHHEEVLRRIERMMHMSVAYVVLEGGTGTLSEFAVVWEYVCKGLIEPRPIFVVGDFWLPLIDRVLTVRPRHGEPLRLVRGPEEILAGLRAAGLDRPAQTG